jgi:hypothetical protein
MEKHTIYGLFIIVSLAFCLALAPYANAVSDEEEVLQVVTNYAKANSSSDFELMSSLHWHSPKLSKFSPRIDGMFLTQGWDTIGENYRALLQGFLGNFVLTPYHPQATMLSDDVAVVTAYYIATGEQGVAGQMRQTLVVQKIGGKWLIVHEHTSNLPTE